MPLGLSSLGGLAGGGSGQPSSAASSVDFAGAFHQLFGSKNVGRGAGGGPPPWVFTAGIVAVGAVAALWMLKGR